MEFEENAKYVLVDEDFSTSWGRFDGARLAKFLKVMEFEETKTPGQFQRRGCSGFIRVVKVKHPAE